MVLFLFINCNNNIFNNIIKNININTLFTINIIIIYY